MTRLQAVLHLSPPRSVCLHESAITTVIAVAYAYPALPLFSDFRSLRSLLQAFAFSSHHQGHNKNHSAHRVARARDTWIRLIGCCGEYSLWLVMLLCCRTSTLASGQGVLHTSTSCVDITPFPSTFRSSTHRHLCKVRLCFSYLLSVTCIA